jgi:hypothetical protein
VAEEVVVTAVAVVDMVAASAADTVAATMVAVATTVA